MANPAHLAILQDALGKIDISIWNTWLHGQRQVDKTLSPDLTDADLTDSFLANAHLTNTYLANAHLNRARLTYANLTYTNLTDADLTDANLTHADLTDADLTDADLTDADLTDANLTHANLTHANLTHVNFNRARLTGADLTRANLIGANLTDTDLTNTDLTNVAIGATSFNNLDLSTVRGLATLHHNYPSEISIRTLYRSHGQIAESFLRGCGVPDTMITFAKSLVGKAIEYYSCFISYSSADELFARRLHNDLQANGVRVWFAPEDLKIGDPIKSTIDESIKLYDKLIIVLSENSIKRAWVHHEITRALEKEKQHNKHVLFPIRLDDSVFNTTEQWAYDIKDRLIGDFTKWDNPLLYQNSINHLLRDLKSETSTP